MEVTFLCMGGKRFNGKCMEPFSHCREATNWYLKSSKERLPWQFWHLLEEISLQSHWRLDEMLQAMWSIIPKIISLWKAHQNIVAVNTVVVDQSIYDRNAMFPYILTISRTIIHETQNSLHRFLPEVLMK